MASTTKIMTAILAVENGNLKDEVAISKRAASIRGSTVGLREGDKLSLEELLYGLLMSSGNDAAIAIAEHIASSEEEFAKMMTKKAYQIGARNTSFANSHGLDADGHFTTAYDMALIARAISLAIDDFSKNRDNVVSIVEDLCTKFPLYE